MTQSDAFLRGRADQVLADLVRHGWRTRAPYTVPAWRAPGAWHHARISGLTGAEAQALAQLARQDRIRLRALAAGLRALRQMTDLRRHPMIAQGFRDANNGRASALLSVRRDPAVRRGDHVR